MGEFVRIDTEGGVAMIRIVHMRPLGAGVVMTTDSRISPLAVRTGRVMRAARSRRNRDASLHERGVALGALRDERVAHSE